MTENQLPTAPVTTPEASASPVDQPAQRTWRDRLPSGRKAVAAGAVVAGLAIGGAGFGAGYAVADNAADNAVTTQTTGTDWGDRGMPGDGGPMGDMDGQMPGGPMGGTTQGDGATGEAPDFDGDGQPDTDSGSGSNSSSSTDSGSTTQQS